MTPTREFEIEKSAETVRAKLFVYDSFPLNLGMVIARIGDIDTNPRASIKLMPKAKMKYDEAYTDCTSKIIAIPDNFPNQLGPQFPRNRFSLAHELGHVALGHKGTRSRAVAGRDFRKDANVPGVRQDEAEAHLWASFFLMPTSIVRNCKTVEELASRCGVSEEAARIRMASYQRGMRRSSGEKRPILPSTQKLLAELFNKAGVEPKAFKISKPEKIKTIEAVGSAENRGYQSIACGECGKFELLREGGCLTCQNCGDSNCN
jgi:Zn-dependent peptidase ImmA (M78 family)